MFPLLDPARECPVCASEGVRPLHVYRTGKSSKIAQVANLALTGCERCGVTFSHPLPTDAELDAYYAGAYWRERIPEDMTDGSGERREAIIALRAIELELLRPHLELPDDQDHTPTAFDFGCGSGEWLDAFADRGWQTAGLEPGEIGEQTGKRHPMVDAIPTEQTYDLVLMNHVLEHLKDPVTTLRELARATLPGGYIFISVPNLSRLPEHQRLSYVASGAHIVTYTSAGLRSALGLAGFDVTQRFDGPEWDEHHSRKAIRLRVLARKTGQVREPGGEPLIEAIESLRSYARGKEREEGTPTPRDHEKEALRRQAKKRAQKAEPAPEEPQGRVERLLQRVRGGRG